jgi:hypothetical protein
LLSTEAMTAMSRRSWTALSCQLIVMMRVGRPESDCASVND